MYIENVEVTNKTGLHARPASEFVRIASEFKSQIKVKANNSIFNAKSIISILSAGIAAGTNIEITADGEDEIEAIEALVKLIQSGFGE